MEHLSDNELIAVFMGYDVYDDEVFGNPIRVFSIKSDDLVIRALNRQHINQLGYDTSWAWLMPVVEKISQIRCAPDSEVNHDRFYLRTFGMLNATTNKPMVRLNRCPVFEADTLIEATYLAVVDFIKSYNKQSN